MKQVKPIRFRIYPEKTLFYDVRVWPDRKSMRRHLRSLGYSKAGAESTEANCRSQMHLRWRPNGKLRANPRCGEINVNRERFNTEIAAHEITHAAIFWAERVGVMPVRSKADADSLAAPKGKPKNISAGPDNERFCYAMGRMIAQFTNHAYRLKVWP